MENKIENVWIIVDKYKKLYPNSYLNNIDMKYEIFDFFREVCDDNYILQACDFLENLKKDYDSILIINN